MGVVYKAEDVTLHRFVAHRAKFRAALLLKLPFDAKVVLCEGRDLMRLETENLFGRERCPSDVVRFVSILSKAGGVRVSLPVAFP